MKPSFAILLTFFALSNALELPKALRPCHRSDPQYSKCLSNVLTTFIISMRSGNKALNIGPVDPMRIDKIIIGGGTSAVTLNQKYTNIDFTGIIRTSVPYINFDFDKLRMQGITQNDKVMLDADYEIDGKVLVLPVRGKGRTHMTLANLNTTHTAQFEKYVANGETYLKVTKYELSFKPEKFTIHYDNLFDGDKVLGEQINTFLNENSDLVFKEFTGYFETVFGKFYKKIANKVLTRFPMKTLFPE